MKLKLFLAAITLYALGAVGFVALHLYFDGADTARLRRVKELGEQLAPLPTPDMQPLSEACAGRLTLGDEHRIAAYVAHQSEETLIGVESGRPSFHRFDLYERSLKEIGDPQLPRMQDALDASVWAAHLESARIGRPELHELQYLVVARYESVTAPVVDDDNYEPGTGSYGARVLAFPSREVLCEGRGELKMRRAIVGTGQGATKAIAELYAAADARAAVPRNFEHAVVTCPLAELCSVGGKELCDRAAESCDVQ